MNDEQQRVDDTEEDQIGKLLRASGTRPLPPPGMAEAVRGAAHVAWRETAARRRQRRQQNVWRLAAGFVLTAGLALWMMSAQRVDEPVSVARLDRSSGMVETGQGTSWTQAAIDAYVDNGEEIRTAPDASAVLIMNDGLAIRIAGGTQLAWLGADRLQLKRGSAYVDTGGQIDSPGALIIETRFGEVRHLGTKYLVSLLPESFQVGVREGRVALTTAAQNVEAGQGEQLVIRDGAAGGEISIARSTIPTWGPLWAWADDLAAPFDIDGRPISEFLDWTTNQTGRQLGYTSFAAEKEARALKLRGDISGLTPEDALAAIMPTTRLDYRLTDTGVLEISLRP